jgi:predicted glycoside hydrolase/deacetylase ChbG (UPF0249 family)
MKTHLAFVFLLSLLFACSTSEDIAITDLSFYPERFLIITADDFGASKNINEGIKIAADDNAITSIAVLANFTESIAELKKIADDHPDISIGVHLNIITGKPILGPELVPSLVDPQGNFYTLEKLLPKLKTISLEELRNELRAQILVLIINDIPVKHLSDQSGILSFYGPFFDIVMELAEEFNLPVRSPLIACKAYPKVFPSSEILKHGRQLAARLAYTNPIKAIELLKYSTLEEMQTKVQLLDEKGIIHPDLLIENFWGNPTPSNLLYIIAHLPAGSSEIIIHCGTSAREQNYPSGLDLDYFSNRETELFTITNDTLKDLYSHLNIIPIGYSGLKSRP